ncbi:MAG: VWA domain-containing protein [Phycisphaerae bacterium]|nr:VWA domain-containing protein [Phycisphaerae bacterium]
MMESPVVRWLFGLNDVALDAMKSASSTRVVFERPLPGWAWFLVLCACAALAWWSYASLRGSRPGRIALGALRASLLALIAILLCGPSLRVAHESVEEDWVLVLADRSRSMSIKDAGSDSAPIERDAALRSAIDGAKPTWATLSKERELVWLGFAAGAFDLAGGADGMPALGDPSGDRTRLDDALNQALTRAAARPIAGIVLFSDGRTSAPPSRALVRRLQAAAAPVFVIPLGSETARGDLAIAKVDLPKRAFVRDEVPVEVEIERPTPEIASPSAKVRLVDATTGATIASMDVPAFEEGETSKTVTLLAKTDVAGTRDWRVEIDAGAEDLVAENNVRETRVEIIDRPLRVLYVDGYPRWEYRYLKNLLVREETIDSSIMLLSADRDFAQEGNMPISRLPRTPEEFANFDLFIIGDVPAGYFTPEQLEAMRDQIAQRGAGLLWIGGERATPKSWEGTALAELLPMRPPLALGAVGGPVNMVASPVAAKLGLLKVGDDANGGWPAELADPDVGWSQLEWAQYIPLEQLKPTAETLASGVPVTAGGPSGASAAAVPLVLSMKYGAGQVIYVATDEIWRWRYGRGERFTEQVWLPLVRMLGREALAGGSDSAVLRAVPGRVQLGQSVRIELVMNDARLADAGENAIAARLTSPDGSRTVDVDLTRTARPGEFALSVSPEEVGLHQVRILSGSASGAEVTFECTRPDEELRRAAADHPLLAQLAADTSGAVLSLKDLSTLPERLQDRSVVTEHATLEPLWDTPIALILFILLATVEWLGRRWLRLA